MMKHWEQLTRLAKQAFSERAFEKSIRFNRLAMGVAQEVFAESFKQDSDKAIATVLVSHFNLVDGYAAIKDFSTAKILLVQAAQFIKLAGESPELSDEQQLALFRGGNRVRTEWAQFFKQHAQALAAISPAVKPLHAETHHSFQSHKLVH